MCIDSDGELPNVTTLKIGAADSERAAPFNLYFFFSPFFWLFMLLKPNFLFYFMGMAYFGLSFICICWISLLIQLNYDYQLYIQIWYIKIYIINKRV